MLQSLSAPQGLHAQPPHAPAPRQRRLTASTMTITHPPIFEVKQESGSNMHHITSASLQPQSRASNSANPALAYHCNKRSFTHRRHLSVPDNVLMMTSSGAASNDLRPRNMADAVIGSSRASNMPIFGRTEEQNFFPHSSFASERSQDLGLLLYEPAPVTAGLPRRASEPDIMSSLSPPQFKLRATRAPTMFKTETGEMLSRSSQLPTPPNSAPLHSVSTFDLAPLPHPNFINLAALAMPASTGGSCSDSVGGGNGGSGRGGGNSGGDGGGVVRSSDGGNNVEGDMGDDSDAASYYSQSSAASPTFSGSPELAHYSFAPSMDSIVEDAPNGLSTHHHHHHHHHSHILPLSLVVPPSAPAAALPPTLQTGISADEINRYISGPEAVDGKWVCLYPACGKRFGRKENIKSHVQTHLGDRQYRCEHCKKCFVRQHDLKRHAKIHTGIKPYPCLCGCSFARHDALTRHRQRGMCIGAFEGIQRRNAKRGRPRKRPLPEDEAAAARSSQNMSQGESGSSQRGNGNGQGTKRGNSDVGDEDSAADCSSKRRRCSELDLSGDTSGSFSSAYSTSAGTSFSSGSSSTNSTYSQSEAGSDPRTPAAHHHYFSSASSASPSSDKEGSPELPMDTPPTSPPEFYEFVSQYSEPPGLYSSSTSAADFPSGSSSPPAMDGEDDAAVDLWAHDLLGLATGGDVDVGVGVVDVDAAGLTALERDPGILCFADDEMYIKPELLAARAP